LEGNEGLTATHGWNEGINGGIKKNSGRIRTQITGYKQSCFQYVIHSPVWIRATNRQQNHKILPKLFLNRSFKLIMSAP
jgi:hypothetical protein